MTALADRNVAENMPQIEVYWMPGCSSCLRLKEFMEESGRQFEAINCIAEPERAEKLQRLGQQVPALCIGDRCVPGADLAAVASLVGVDYRPPEILSAAELREKYLDVLSALSRMTRQLTPEAAEFMVPNRDRTLLQLAGHASGTTRYFIGKYYDDAYDGKDYLDDSGCPNPSELLDYIEQTRALFEQWWDQDGAEDPMDADTVLSLYWGHRTVLEALEREVWHAAHHTRQLAHWLTELGITPDGPLTPEQLAGLPLPTRIHD